MMRKREAEGSSIKDQREAFDRMMREKEQAMEDEKRKNAEELEKMMQ